VLTAQDEPVRADVAVFLVQKGTPAPPPLTHCEVQAGQRFSVRVPAGVPLLVVAMATNTFDPHFAAIGHLLTGDSKIVDPQSRWVGFLPATAQLEIHARQPHVLPDLRLPVQSLATGVVLRDGQPVVGARVTCRAAGAVATFGNGLQWLADGTVVLPTTMNSDAQGRFVLPGPADVAMELAVTAGTPLRPREAVVAIRLPATTTVILP
jgi:hypothetical protein